MIFQRGIAVLVVVALLTSQGPSATRAEDPARPGQEQSGAGGSLDDLDEDASFLNDPLLSDHVLDLRSDAVLRFGWWATSRKGDDVKIGEFQDLDASPFWDLDGIWSDGIRTLDFSGSLLDNEGNSGYLNYFGPDISADIEYGRFIRRWDHKPLTGGTPTSSTQVVSEDLNVGEDYAIRVQELSADFEGRMNDRVRWKLNLWGMRKFGERQANATAHCFNLNFGDGPADNRCHVLSQQQRIDWITLEIEPALEANFDWWTIEYARTMRAFGTSDARVTRSYNHFGPFGGRGDFETEFPYALVPDSFTQIDRIKIGADLDEENNFYGYLFHGNTRNQFRETDRRFRGFDLRLTNRSFEGLTLTAYGKLYDDDNEIPGSLLPEEDDPSQLRHPIDYLRTRAGLTGRWRPLWDSASMWQGFSIRSGYEFYDISRSFARFEVEGMPDFVQSETVSHQLDIAPTMRWSPEFDTYVRYRARFIEDPLGAVQHNSGDFNTALPDFENLVEIGGSWAPLPNLLASAQFGIENRLNNSGEVDFQEDDYPIVCTLWYAPTPKLSLSGGYALYTNWIDQDITLGFRDPSDPFPADTLRFRYGGRAAVINFGSRYAWSDRLEFTGGIEWVRGRNVFSVPTSPSGADWSLLPELSDVTVETLRYTAGLDFEVRRNVDCFFRYNYFDYEDMSESFNSGTAHFFLAGVSANY